MIPTIEWDGMHVRMIDQRKIPSRIDWYICRGYRDVIKAIEKMVIRGAPAIGVAGAMGLALGAYSIRTKSKHAFLNRFKDISNEMLLARPTAVNLRWAVERMESIVKKIADRPVNEIKSVIKQESEKSWLRTLKLIE